jgi:hypothetical protein
VKCPGIDGLIEEADELAGEIADKEVLDAVIVGSAQAVEHYEIARYGTLIAWADELGRDDVVRVLTTNLNEEKAADKAAAETDEKWSPVGPGAPSGLQVMRSIPRGSRGERLGVQKWECATEGIRGIAQRHARLGELQGYGRPQGQTDIGDHRPAGQCQQAV